MSFPPLNAFCATRGTSVGAALASPPQARRTALPEAGSMPDFLHDSLSRPPEKPALHAVAQWEQTPTFAARTEKAALEMPAHETTDAGRQFVLDFLQACRERGHALDSAVQAAAERNRTMADLQGGIHTPFAERNSAFVDTLLASIRLQGRVLPLGDPAFHATLARYAPHMRRILEALARRVVIPSALDWQVAAYASRLARVSQIVQQQHLAGAEDFCRLFIEPEPNATVARQQRDWDQRLAELAPASSAQWQLRRRAAAALAPLLNPQVARHLVAALQA